MGRALARTLTATETGRRRDRAAENFAHAFLDQVAVPETAHFVIDLDTLAATAQRACASLTTAAGPGVTDWTAAVAQRLGRAVVPVLQRRPTRTEWAALRLPALALAAEADALAGPAAGDDFRQLAAGITLLQQRAHDRPRPETILLARD